jgi:hypothetical protein
MQDGEGGSPTDFLDVHSQNMDMNVHAVKSAGTDDGLASAVP